MTYISHTLTANRPNTKRWHNPALNFKSHSIPTRVQNCGLSIRKLLYTPLFIESRAELTKRFYNRSSYKGERIIQSKISRWRKSKKENNYKQSNAFSLLSVKNLIFYYKRICRFVNRYRVFSAVYWIQFEITAGRRNDSRQRRKVHRRYQ